ncbi:protein-L-isoaspartate(D-aspartate) O-methyltransferase [Planctomycetota bacterium]
MYHKQNEDEFESAKQYMLRRDLKGRGISNPRVLAAMAEVAREEFIPESHKSQAYKDGPLPIGLEQTISQPFIVALMTEQLHITKDSNVLEIGTGSGYQTAILGKLAKRVYTVERHAELSEVAQEVLNRLGYDNIEFYIGDGSPGWPKELLPQSGFFERIMLTAAVPKIPDPIIKQLCEGGLLIAPVDYSISQELILFEKRENKLIETNICEVRFVKLYGQYGF